MNGLDHIGRFNLVETVKAAQNAGLPVELLKSDMAHIAAVGLPDISGADLSWRRYFNFIDSQILERVQFHNKLEAGYAYAILNKLSNGALQVGRFKRREAQAA